MFRDVSILEEQEGRTLYVRVLVENEVNPSRPSRDESSLNILVGLAPPRGSREPQPREYTYSFLSTLLDLIFPIVRLPGFVLNFIARNERTRHELLSSLHSSLKSNNFKLVQRNSICNVLKVFFFKFNIANVIDVNPRRLSSFAQCSMSFVLIECEALSYIWCIVNNNLTNSNWNPSSISLTAHRGYDFFFFRWDISASIHYCQREDTINKYNDK